MIRPTPERLAHLRYIATERVVLPTWVHELFAEIDAVRAEFVAFDEGAKRDGEEADTRWAKMRDERNAVRAERDALIQLGTRHGAWTPDTIRDELQVFIQAAERKDPA